MMTFTTIQTEKLNLELRFDGQGDREILYDGKRYGTLEALFETLPQLKSENMSETAAKIINFMLQGASFEVIVNPHKFKEEYQKRVLQKTRGLEEPNPRAYGVYDIEKITLPKWDRGVIHFFAVNTTTGVPYQVTFTPPEKKQGGTCQYQLLPSQ